MLEILKKSKYEKILIGSDIHGPYVDHKAYNCFLNIASRDWDRIILNGDIADFAQLSSHDKKIGSFDREFHDEITLPSEIRFIKQEILAPLRRAAGKTPIMMRLGNHEIRFLMIADNNPSALAELLKTMRETQSIYLEGVLELDKYKIKLSYAHQDILYNTFTVVHGVKTSPGVAKANLIRYGSGTSGHSHRMNAWTQVFQGSVQGWWESGCLRTTKAIEYLPHGDLPDWSNGFLTLYIDKKSGHFFCTPHFIIDGECEFNGEIIKG